MTAEIERRLVNWGLCMRLNKPPEHCKSAEWRHVQHRGLTEGEEDTRRRAKIDRDELDAILVERAWRKLAEGDRKLLLWKYIWRSTDKQICRRAGICADTIDGTFYYLLIALRGAHRNMGYALDSLHLNVDASGLNSHETVERL